MQVRRATHTQVGVLSAGELAATTSGLCPERIALWRRKHAAGTVRRLAALHLESKSERPAIVLQAALGPRPAVRIEKHVGHLALAELEILLREGQRIRQ